MKTSRFYKITKIWTGFAEKLEEDKIYEDDGEIQDDGTRFEYKDGVEEEDLDLKSHAEVVYVDEEKESFKYMLFLMFAIAVVGFCYCGGLRYATGLVYKCILRNGYRRGFANSRDGYTLMSQSSKRAWKMCLNVLRHRLDCFKATRWPSCPME